MEIDPRRKPAHNLLTSMVQKMKAAHLSITEEVVKVFPETKNWANGCHKDYCQRLDSIVKQARHPRNEDEEPVWNIMVLFSADPDCDAHGADTKLSDQIEKRFGFRI